jgi:hypothetical protein
MDVVDGPMEGCRFDPFEGDNLARQQALERAYRLRGKEGLRRELEAQEKLRTKTNQSSETPASTPASAPEPTTTAFTSAPDSER